MSQYTQSPQYPQPGVPAPAPVAARNGLGTAALILGIVGVLAGLPMFLFWLAGILGLIGLILGITGRGRVKRGEATNKGAATTGVVLGVVALILSVVGAVVTFAVVSDAVDEINKSTSSSASSKTKGNKDNKGSKDGKSDKGAAGEDATGEALGAGDSAVYDDKLTITVSEPKPYTPGEYAVGHTKGNKAYKVTIVIENAGKEKFDASLVTAEARAGEDGVNAEQIFDGKVGGPFTGTVLPGKKATVTWAFDAAADAKNLTIEISPGIAHDDVVWDLKL
ncbi:DUF4190 domain-containing protein [Streptomyces sp. NPDC127084]|uniref:DUF4190 domain-containing protein n=1 Tax=Streptomyces sp. NPDC127084 TaxID=3347133 RepID=UPI00366028EA